MSLGDFPRVSLMFGPSPLQSAHPTERRSARQGRDLGQARALQQRLRLWRLQGAQARVPRRGRARQGLRHARLRRRIQSNHTHAVTGVARHPGLNVVTVQEHWVDREDPGYDVVGNIQLTQLDVRAGARSGAGE